MTGSLEEILMDLKIVSMVQPHQKLTVENNRLALDGHANTYWRALWRYLGHQTRHNVVHKIRQRVGELESYVVHDLVREAWMMREIRALRGGVIRGLRQLQETYEDDSQLFVHLDLIAKRLEHLPIVAHDDGNDDDDPSSV